MPSIFEKVEPYLFLTPALVILLVFLIFPLFWNTYISLHDVSLTTILREWQYIGGTNFINLFNDPSRYGLRLTRAGLVAIGIEPEVESTSQGQSDCKESAQERKARRGHTGDRDRSAAPRRGSEQV